MKLSNKDTSTTGSLNLLLGTTTEEAGLDNEGLSRETTSGQDLSEPGLKSVDNGGSSLGDVLLGNHRGELIDVDDGLPLGLTGQVEVTHTDLTEVAGMVTVHVDAVMVHTTGKTTTSGMLAVLSNTTVTGRNVSALLAIFLIVGGLSTIRLDGCITRRGKVMYHLKRKWTLGPWQGSENETFNRGGDQNFYRENFQIV